MAFVAVYDACVLYPNYLRDLLIRIARTDLVRARWTNAILDEVFASIRKGRPDLDPAKLERTRRLVCDAVDDCLVEGYESLASGLALPDANDRHVLAAAIRAGAQVIVTWNLKDFPPDELLRHDVTAIDPDEFVVNQIDLKPGVVVRLVTEALSDYTKPPLDLEDLLEIYERSGLVRTVALLRALMG